MKMEIGSASHHQLARSEDSIATQDTSPPPEPFLAPRRRSWNKLKSRRTPPKSDIVPEIEKRSFAEPAPTIDCVEPPVASEAPRRCRRINQKARTALDSAKEKTVVEKEASHQRKNRPAKRSFAVRTVTRDVSKKASRPSSKVRTSTIPLSSARHPVSTQRYLSANHRIDAKQRSAVQFYSR